MYFFFAIIGCLFLYRTSKYYPAEVVLLEKSIRLGSRNLRIIGLAFLTISAILSTVAYGLGTGLLLVFAAVIFGLSFLIIIVPLNRKWIYLMAGICVLLIVLENIL